MSFYFWIQKLDLQPSVSGLITPRTELEVEGNNLHRLVSERIAGSLQTIAPGYRYKIVFGIETAPYDDDVLPRRQIILDLRGDGRLVPSKCGVAVGKIINELRYPTKFG